MSATQRDQKLKVGIAGYGVVGKRRRFFIDQHPAFLTTAVCDQTFQSKEALSDGITAYRDYLDLINNEKLDVLFVCLPNYLASKVTVTALQKGLHVFCEKPPGRDLNDIANVLEAEKNFPALKVMYGFNHRYHDSVQEALGLIHSGELGTLINLRGVYGKSKMITFDRDWRTERQWSGGGILLDQGIHMVDMLRLFAGDFNDVHSFISNTYWNHDVEDNAYAMMRTPQGIVAMLHSSATQWRHSFRLELALTRGGIILSGILSSTKSYGKEQITIIYKSDDDSGDPRQITKTYNKDHSWADEIATFADVITNSKKVISGSAIDAYKTMELVYKIYCADLTWSQKYKLFDKPNLVDRENQ